MLSRSVNSGPPQKLVYNKNFDHSLRNLAQANKGAEECAENESIKEEWDKEENAGEGDTALSLK